MTFAVAAVRQQFPVLAENMQGKPLVFLDTGASAQKPQCVIDAMTNVLQTRYSNVHRGLYAFSQNLTADYEAVRAQVAQFLGAQTSEIIFTKSATESINLVANTWGMQNLKVGDEILLTTLEHHANIVPWQMLAAKTGAIIKVVPLNDDYSINLNDFEAALSPRTKLAAFTHMSNVTGAILPVAGMVRMAKNVGAITLVDGCQAVAHMPLNMAQLGCDFYTFSGHKLYGPTGVGVLFGKAALLENMPPFLGGGDMVESVSFDALPTFKPAPAKFEAGTPPIVEVIGLGAALDFWTKLDHTALRAHEQFLLQELYDELAEIDGIKIFQPQHSPRAALLSFVVQGCHAADIGTLLAQQGVAVRVGHHCAMPLHQALGQTATIRASLGCYNTEDDVRAFITAMHKAVSMLS